ncbi:radical SAM family heme chaperone HemW [Phycisphaera mikurensis]|uniref:Heme chaperone HemW n=1 Tax=Phycisphaera mikurensis (strain NBRC 102666 / KCTC 22515 / FYK2301M01) TaxID=1142394 RepID=I0IE16_PHYMF|nr:radical SAM family heme chaperone HemW [Phycisphaera mikurensis]MBB6441311.1 oxygen-independent coproporphyrinogen-3 oxidase [Phycisphaera mikurensis]BAM03504.1 oxygen-independent coproporphyrinogen III oxidase [Phycisphaera mikurensis NBRC 102666]
MRELQAETPGGAGGSRHRAAAAGPRAAGPAEAEPTAAAPQRQETDEAPFIPNGDRPTPVDGLYLHLPFCFHKCHYCDFFSVVAPPSELASAQRRFTDALRAELDAAAGAWAGAGVPLRPRTAFAGGGTPTLLAAEHWRALLGDLRRRGVLDACVEFTAEANPETVTPAVLAALRGGGVDRLSIGAQSFDRGSLAALERWHAPESVGRAVELARAAGFDNVSLDLIWAIPGQTLAMLDADLDRLLGLEPEHLSAYGLTFEPQTPLAARLRVGKVAEVEEDLQRAMYARVMERLDAAGYEQYELSNWARRGARDLRCKHNLHYWRNASWLGLGPAAASHLDGLRFRNRPNLPAYEAALLGGGPPPRVDVERLPAARRLGERLMLGLRLAEGVNAASLEAELPAGDPRRDHLQDCRRLGLLEAAAGRLRLTHAGRFVADGVLVRLL